ncbi:DMKN, partial [Cervus elaphus hippelaphus]
GYNPNASSGSRVGSSGGNKPECDNPHGSGGSGGQGQAPPPSTRALLYFRRLWEDFKHNTPFLNWKVITEGEDVPSLQKRAGGAGQNYNYNQQGPPTALGGQYPAKTPAKGGVTVSSSASRMHPGLLQWVKFW